MPILLNTMEQILKIVQNNAIPIGLILVVVSGVILMWKQEIVQIILACIAFIFGFLLIAAPQILLDLSKSVQSHTGSFSF